MIGWFKCEDCGAIFNDSYNPEYIDEFCPNCLGDNVDGYSPESKEEELLEESENYGFDLDEYYDSAGNFLNPNKDEDGEDDE